MGRNGSYLRGCVIFDTYCQIHERTVVKLKLDEHTLLLLYTVLYTSTFGIDQLMQWRI